MLIRSIDINCAIVCVIVEDPSVFSNCHRCAAVGLQDMVACGIHIADFTVNHDGAVFCIDDIAVQLGAIRDFGAVFHFEGFGITRTVDYAAAGDFLNQCGGGQRSLCVIAQMNYDAAIRLPHCTLVCGNAADGAADLNLPAVCINSTTVHIPDLRAFLHHECTALKPDRTCRTD